jgi:hypothetical protein
MKIQELRYKRAYIPLRMFLSVVCDLQNPQYRDSSSVDSAKKDSQIPQSRWDLSSVEKEQQSECRHAVRYANRHNHNLVAYLWHAGCGCEAFFATELQSLTGCKRVGNITFATERSIPDGMQFFNYLIIHNS